MFKNKYVFWSFIAVWVIGLGAGGAWFWHKHASTQEQARTAALTSATNRSPTPSSAPTQNQTITPITGSTGTTINGGGTVAGASTTVGSTTTGTNTGTNASSLLDPKTFGQYDKYKNDQAALFIDLQPGTGDAVASGKKVAVYYRGWLTNGTLFDESKAGSDGKLQPFVFTQGSHQVVSGWEQALEGMKTGGVRLLVVPPAAGYGTTAQGPIPANSVLVFQVQLVAVQ